MLHMILARVFMFQVQQSPNKFYFRIKSRNKRTWRKKNTLLDPPFIFDDAMLTKHSFYFSMPRLYGQNIFSITSFFQLYNIKYRQKTPDCNKETVHLCKMYISHGAGNTFFLLRPCVGLACCQGWVTTKKTKGNRQWHDAIQRFPLGIDCYTSWCDISRLCWLI